MGHDAAFRTTLAAGLGLVAAAGNLIGGYFVVRRDWPRRVLQYFLALGAGYMEHTVAPHFHFGEETHLEEMSHQHARTTVLLGLTIHTFFDGVAIAAGFLVSTWLGAVIFVAVFLHKLPEGFTVASVVLASGQGKRNAMQRDSRGGVIRSGDAFGGALDERAPGAIEVRAAALGGSDFVRRGNRFAAGSEPGAELAHGIAGVRWGC